jgi:hypothetical protein
MRANKRLLFTLGVLGIWTIITLLIIKNNHDNQKNEKIKTKIHEKIVFLENEIKKETHERKEIITQYNNLIKILSARTSTTAESILSNKNQNNNDVSIQETETKNDDQPQWNSKISFNGKYIDNDINKPVIPVLVIACNRVSISRSLDTLIKYRPDREQFPIIVSQVSNNSHVLQ